MTRDIHIRLAFDRPSVRSVFALLLLAAPMEIGGEEQVTFTATYPPATGIFRQLITTGGSAAAPVATILNQVTGDTILAGNGKVGVGSVLSSPTTTDIPASYKLFIKGSNATSPTLFDRGNLKVSGAIQMNVPPADLTLGGTGAGLRGEGASPPNLIIQGNSASPNFDVTDAAGGTSYAKMGSNAFGGNKGGILIGGNLDIADSAGATNCGGKPCGYIQACFKEPYNSAGTCSGDANNYFPVYVDSDRFGGQYSNNSDPTGNTNLGPTTQAVGAMQICCKLGQ